MHDAHSRARAIAHSFASSALRLPYIRPCGTCPFQGAAALGLPPAPSLVPCCAAVPTAGAATPPSESASTTAAGLAQTRALLAALQKSSPTVAAAGSTSATARALIAQLDALKPSAPVSRTPAGQVAGSSQGRFNQPSSCSLGPPLYLRRG